MTETHSIRDVFTYVGYIENISGNNPKETCVFAMCVNQPNV